MRKLIAAMKTSVDGKIEGPEGFADWVDAWTDDYGLTPQIDACLLGARMYSGYEPYWTAMQNEPDKPLPMTGSCRHRLNSSGRASLRRRSTRCCRAH